MRSIYLRLIGIIIINITPLAWAGDQVVFGPRKGESIFSISEYSNMMGNNGGSSTSESPFNNSCPSAGSFSNLRVRITAAPGAGNSRTYTFRNNGADTALACTISGASDTTCSDTSDSISITAGDDVSFENSQLCCPNAANFDFSARFTSTTAGETIMLGGIGNGDIDTSRYLPVMGTEEVAGGGDSEAAINMVMPVAGTAKNLYVDLTAVPGVGNSWAMTLRKNGADTALTCTISGLSTTCTDTSNTVSIAVGDLLAIAATETGTATITKMKPSLTYLVGTDGDFVVSAASREALSTSATQYLNPDAGDTGESTTENDVDNISEDFTVKSIYVDLGTAPGASKSRVFTLRQNDGDASPTLSCTVSDTSTTCNASATVLIADGDSVDTSSAVSSTPAGSEVTVSYLGTTAAAVERRIMIFGKRRKYDENYIDSLLSNLGVLSIS